MLTKIMKITSIVALLVGIVWTGWPNYRVLLSFLVTIGAVVVVVQAARATKHAWVALFVIIAAFFNPILMVPLPRRVSLWADLACLAAFATSLIVLKTTPTLSMASITDRTPGSESL